MNKYKSIYVEDILAAEREEIRAILYGKGGLSDTGKVMLIKGMMGLTEKLIEEEGGDQA